MKLLYINKTVNINRKVYKKDKPDTPNTSNTFNTSNISKKWNKSNKSNTSNTSNTQVPSILNILNCSQSVDELKILLLKNNNLDIININIEDENKIENVKNIEDENKIENEENIEDEDENNEDLDLFNINIDLSDEVEKQDIKSINSKSKVISIEQEKQNSIILQNRLVLEKAINNINQKFENDINIKMEELEKLKKDFMNTIKNKRDDVIKYTESKLSNCEIPLIIFQTWITSNLPPKMLKTVNKLKATNPEFEHRLFDDNDIRAFLTEYFNPDVLFAFNKLVPGAFRADLWRYCVLYIYGGIYLDIKYEPINNFKFLDIIDKEYVTLDRNHFGGALGIYNGFIIAKPNNDIFLKLINKVIENVKSKFYGCNALQVTGPTLMGQIMFPNKRFNEMCNSFNMKYSTDGMGIIFKDKRILQQYSEYRKEQSALPKSNYQLLWERRGIYY